MRQRPLRLSDERFLIARTLVTRCAPGLRTTSPTLGWHRLVVPERGSLIVRTPAGNWWSAARDAVWAPAGVHIELESCAVTSLRIIYLRDGRAAWTAPGFPRDCAPIMISPILQALAGEIARVGALDRRRPRDASMAALLLHEVRAGAATPTEIIWPSDPRAARVAAAVRDHPGSTLTLPQLCRGCGAGPRTIQRIFPSQTGLAFDAWRTRVRLDHAQRLLADGEKVDAVARQCGYRSASSFVVAFTRATGITPGRFRRRR